MEIKEEVKVDMLESAKLEAALHHMKNRNTPGLSGPRCSEL